MTGGEDGFLSRWSRLKREGAPADEEPVAAGADEAGDADEAEFDPETLPDPDSLGPGDDFSVFLKSRVPEELRRRALRRLWRSNPVLACLDGLNDYDGDFTGGSVATGELKTAFEVGRGIVREVARALPEAESPAAPAPVDEGIDPAQDAPAATPDATESALADPDYSPPGPTLRRMRFSFPDDA